MSIHASSPAPRASCQTCDYLALHNQPCGEPATHSFVTPARKRFYVCPDHCSQVYRDTKKKVNPTPLVATILEEKTDMLPLAVAAVCDRRPPEPQAPRPAPAIYVPTIPVLAGKSLSQLFREMQESKSEGSDLL